MFGLATLVGMIAGTVAIVADGAPDVATPGIARTPATDPISSRSASGDVAGNQVERWAKTALSRPLFNADRRPVAQLEAGSSAAGPPRLSGIMITPAGRQAIFALAGGKPAVVTTGGSAGGYVVESIDGRTVVVIGPTGRHRLQPTFQAGAGAQTTPEETEETQ